MEHKLNAALRVIKRNQKLWIIIGIAIVLVSAIGATLITAHRVANLAAQSATVQTNKYLDNVTNAAQVSADPKQILAAVQEVEVPEFPEVQLGAISESYRNARVFYDGIIEKVTIFTQHIESYAKLQDFNESYRTLASQLEQQGTTNAEARYETLKDINALITDTSAPAEFKEKFTEVGRVYTSLERNWEGIMTAQEMNNTEAYEMLNQQYTIAAAQVPRVQTDITTYVDGIDEKVKRMVEDLKQYRAAL